MLTLILDKMDNKTINIIRDKNGHFRTIKEPTNLEVIQFKIY